MIHFKNVLKASLYGLLVLSLSGNAAGSGRQSDTQGSAPATQAGVGNGGEDSDTGLDAAEETHLVFMREEEKLARDVYLTLAQWYPYQTVFDTIASGSEQTHTDLMRDELADFGIEDPNPDTNQLPEAIGVFTGETYGAYFTEKFSQLTDQATLGELQALYVGAFIEELDMHDIAECPQVIVDMDNDIDEGECGMNSTDEVVIIDVYSTLLDGSESHLRAFVGRIEAVIGIGNYEAQYLSQQEVDSILGR